MPLADCQVQVRDLVMGPGTDYKVLDFNPWSRAVRSDQGGSRAWNHGSWSGAEWAEEAVVPLRVKVRDAPDRNTAAWLSAQQQLSAAFAPIGDVVEDVELRFHEGGAEYVMFGRPRMVEVDGSLRAVGFGFARCAFVAQDPRIYSGTPSTTGAVALPTPVGGLTLPFLLPAVVPGSLLGGDADLVNSGTTDTGLLLRIDGPVAEPRVALLRPDGSVQEIRFDLELAASQYLLVDTAARTALLNGSPSANQRGRADWDMDPYPLPPGTTSLRFRAADFTAGTLTASWRSAWW